jgi:O-methyltransferase involved in polyketide biosynthesis
MDARLTDAVERGDVTQVVEIACGLSPDGWRFTACYPALHYVEADLPVMVAPKRLLLQSQGWLGT